MMGLLLLIALPSGAQGTFDQWRPVGPPSGVEHQFVTTNGVTYFRMSGLLSGGHCCQRIAGYDVRRQDSTFSQVIQHETWGGACIMMMCDPWREEVVSRLGALPPGNYTLALFAESMFAPFPSQWASLSFTVPGELRPALVIGNAPQLASSSSLLIQVTQVANVTCVLEASTNLSDWTAVQTNSGPQVTFSVSPSEGHRFYRALVRTP
jgi:hypothetical protein